MGLFQFTWICGFATVLMFFAWLQFMLLPIGGLFGPKANPWLLLLAAIWPFSLVAFLGLGALAITVTSRWEKMKERGGNRRSVMPPYDGSLKRRRYWKKVKEQ